MSSPTVGSGLVTFGKFHAVVGAIVGTAVGIALIVVGIADERATAPRDTVVRQYDPDTGREVAKHVTQTVAQQRSMGKLFIGIGALIMIVSWAFAYFAFHSKNFAMFEGLMSFGR